MIRVAVIGCGNISPAHICSYVAFPDRCKIVALCDIYPEKAEKKKKQAGKATAKALRKANPNRYKNPNLTEDDLWYYVNGIQCGSIDVAVAVAKEIFEKSVIPGSAGPQLDHWSDAVVRNKFLGRLEACRHFHPEAIDGTKHFCVYKYLQIWTVVKEDVQ